MRPTTADEFENQRPLLTGLAYRLLGEIHEAEDAVQDAYLRWSAADRDLIEAPHAWLAKVVTNLCLNRLTSARARRETYVGPWLPEPVLTGSGPAARGTQTSGGTAVGLAGTSPLGPLETAEQRDSVSFAMLALMERLTPSERAVFVLREAFSYSHQEIADVLDLSEAASRQLHHRARQRLGDPRRRFETSPEHWHHLVERFLGAAAGGDVDELHRLLADDVVAWGDGGGKASAARRPVVGVDNVVHFTVGLARQLLRDGTTVTLEQVNGNTGLVVHRDGALHAIMLMAVADDGKIGALYSVVNPDKLRFAARQLA